MGYTYNESLQKAHDILDEAQRKSNNILGEAERVNALNKNVQQQINTLIAESGTSDAEVLQARIDAEGNEYPVLKERLDESDAQLAQIVTLIDNYPLIIPETTDGPRIQRAIDDIHSKGGGTIKLPNEYTSNQTLIMREKVKLIGDKREASKIIFDGVSGIDLEERTDNFAIEDITIEGIEASRDTIGMNFDYYSSYYQIRNVNVNKFGAWGIKIGGGIKWAIEEVDFMTNGRNASDPEESGSLFINVGNDDYTLRSVGSRILNCYARTGGKYALKLYRPTDIYINLYIAEYHDKALYAEAANGIVENFYQEANKSSNNDIIHLHNTGGLIFIGGNRTTPAISGGDILYTYGEIAPASRFPPLKLSGRELLVREVSTPQLNLKDHVSINPKKGSVRYNHGTDELEIHNEERWVSVNNNIESNFNPDSATFDLGNVNKRSFLELSITMQTESAHQYSHRNVYIRTNSYGEILNTETVLNMGSLGEVDLRIDDDNRLLLELTGHSSLPTYYNIKVNNLYGKRFVERI